MSKNIIVLLASMFSLISIGKVVAQDSLEIGDNVTAIINAYMPQFKIPGPSVMDAPEGVVDYYVVGQKVAEEDPKFLVVKDKYFIGVLQKKNGEDQILLDANGDGTVDYASRYLHVPYWVVAREYKHDVDAEDNMERYLDTAADIFNSDENPYTSGKYIALSQELLADSNDENNANRDLIYALYCYYLLGNEYPWAATKAIGYVGRKYIDRYGQGHPIIYLHILESLINLGYPEDARTFLDDLVDEWPWFVPGLVYQWQLEKDQEKKNEMYKTLKEEYSDHWIVKQI